MNWMGWISVRFFSFCACCVEEISKQNQMGAEKCSDAISARVKHGHETQNAQQNCGCWNCWKFAERMYWGDFEDEVSIP